MSMAIAVIAGVLFLIFLIGSAVDENAQSVPTYFLGTLFSVLVLTLALVYNVAYRYEGYPSRQRVKDGIYQNVAEISSGKDRYLVVHEQSGDTKLLSLSADDQTSGTWLKAYPGARPDSFVLRPLEKIEAKTLYAEKP